MYPVHKRILACCFIATGLISFWLNIPFEKIASDSITIVSIAIAIYMTAITLLIGSKIVESMGKADDIIKTKTKLGVLTVYLKSAVWTGIISIIDCCFLKMYADEYYHGIDDVTQVFQIVYRIAASFGMALFVITLIFMILILYFISASILKQIR